MPLYKPTWNSLSQHADAKWFGDGKFGIFIHWGPYCVPEAFNEWYPRNMYQPHMKEFEYHRKTWGDHKKFGYKDFIPLFKAQHFDPEHWAKLFKKSGARYVVPVAEHHDSFAMYKSSHTRWNAVDMGPKRDVLGELFKEIRKQGMIAGTSSHLAFNWWYFRKNIHFDTSDPLSADLYGGIHDVKSSLRPLPKKLHWELFTGTRPNQAFLDLWWKRCTEIVDRYQPQLIYFDWCWGQPEWDFLRRRFAAYYYNRGRQWGKEVTLIYKEEVLEYGTATFDVERGGLDMIRPRPWQIDTSISWNSWCAIKNDELRSAQSIIHLLCDAVSKNGNLMLNVGPKADGTIPAAVEDRLLDVGSWLEKNGEAIYGTRPHRIFGEGESKPKAGTFAEDRKFSYTPEDFRFTRKGSHLYAISLGVGKRKLKIKSLGRESLLGGKIMEASLLGAKGRVKWSQERQHLALELPAGAKLRHAAAFKLLVKGGEDF